MKFYLGVTDYEWFSFLSERRNEDINFWQPGGIAGFKVLNPGDPFLFKLKYPLNAISGIGFYSTHSILPLDVAWDIFGERNGVESYLKFKQKIISYRTASNTFESNPNIGCIVLTDPILFNKEDWITVPKSWGKSIVQGKSYSTDDFEGADLWTKIEQRLANYDLFQREEIDKSQFILEDNSSSQYSKKYLTKIRYGQGAFRVLLTDAYNRKCAISGEKTLPALEAAHIKPYADSGPNYICNGLLLRADIHKLFDAGYLTVTKDYKIEVSSKIKEEFENGKNYYQYHGGNIKTIPHQILNHPDLNYLEWHNSNIYIG
ncbi:HNH endonuclease [bacterium]|nr:HNH endonuclease [bacterium]